MKITSLADNLSARDDLTPEHGLSLYIETNTHKILFDMGQTDLLLQNAKTLGIDLSQVDIAILSHGHYDHGGGFSTFRTVNSHAPLYVSPHAFGEFYSDKYIGLSNIAPHDPLLVMAEGTMYIAEGITLYADCPIPLDKTIGNGLYRKKNGILVPDDFRHEIYLVIEENGRKVLFCGCSHRGAVNIAHRFAPDIFIGGFHLKNLSPARDQKYLTDTAASLMEQSTTYYTCHCTGAEQYAFLKEHMKNRLHYLSLGEQVCL